MCFMYLSPPINTFLKALLFFYNPKKLTYDIKYKNNHKCILYINTLIKVLAILINTFSIKSFVKGTYMLSN